MKWIYASLAKPNKEENLRRCYRVIMLQWERLGVKSILQKKYINRKRIKT